MNRIIKAIIPALFIHVSIGTVYCWSTFSEQITEQLGLEITQTNWAFSIAIFFLGMSAAFMGKTVEMNIKRSALISCCFFSVGFIGTGVLPLLHIQNNTINLLLLYLFYGAIMGVGLGVGYLTPVKNLMLWFPKNKGLATGISIMGFGLAKAIGSPIMNWLLAKTTISNMFFILGGVYLILIFIAFLVIRKPYGWFERPSNEKHIIKNKPLFVSIWIIFYINITCGLALISYEKIILEYIGIGLVGISIIQAMTAVSNAVGRIGSATISDYCKDRKTIYIVIFLVCAAITDVCFLVYFIPIIVIGMLIIINFGYGGGFSTLPALLESRFGMKNISQIHGLALSAWAFAGLTGNQITSLSLTLTGNYRLMIFIISILYTIGLIITINLNRIKTYGERKESHYGQNDN